MDGLVANDPALADFLAPRLELRLDQRDDVGPWFEQRRHDREDVPERNERDVDHHDPEGAQVFGKV